MNGPVTVLYVQPSSEIGGSDIALYRLVAELDRSRYRPVVVLPRDGPLVANLRAVDVAVRFLPMLQLRPVRDPAYQLRFALRFWPSVSSQITSKVPIFCCKSVSRWPRARSAS